MLYIDDLFKVFPAPAGVILSALLFRKLTFRFPRTCGGDPVDRIGKGGII